ncbi:MAG: Kae1-associated kinase Bud32 [Thermoprotei archaeon]|nr:MAG: Kae1-associated kinase Bud32 [Thermoprotei archaeon]
MNYYGEVEEALRRIGARLREMLSIGAEAVLARCYWRGFEAVAKYRLPKPYRDGLLDKLLRSRRTVLEAKLLVESKRVGVPTPSLLYVNPDLHILLTDFIPGVKLRDVLTKLQEPKDIFRRIGVYAGLLHERGIVHGDLTTSNMLVVGSRIFVIDFGLGDFSNELEQHGVDVHLMLRSLESTHPSLVQPLYAAFLEGYAEVRGEDMRRAVEVKVKEIRRRGRYVVERRLRR